MNTRGGSASGTNCKIVKVLKKPCKYFTADSSRYGTVQTYTTTGSAPFFREDECVISYVHSGSGFLRDNQTLYPLRPGCLCSLYQFHVFRFETPPEAPLSLEAIPYPEMAYFNTGYKDCRQIEQLLHLYREESQLTDEDSRLIPLSIQDQLRALYGTAKPVPPLYPTPLCGQMVNIASRL